MDFLILSQYKARNGKNNWQLKKHMNAVTVQNNSPEECAKEGELQSVQILDLYRRQLSMSTTLVMPCRSFKAILSDLMCVMKCMCLFIMPI